MPRPVPAAGPAAGPPGRAAAAPGAAAAPARDRWVPGRTSTQLITGAAAGAAAPVDETDEDVELREGAPGASGGILRAAGTMAVATLVSRITGLLRTMVLAAALGVALVGDAYNTANTLPNIVYELLLGGVLTSVIVPLLVHAQERDRDGGVGVRPAAGHAGHRRAGRRDRRWPCWPRRC